MATHKILMHDGDALEIETATTVGTVARIVITPQVLVGTETSIWPTSAVQMPLKNTDKAWYEATRRYGPYRYHPQRCEDWNLETGGNTDLGEPLVAPFNGLVLSARNWGGNIGRVVQILGGVDAQMVVWAGWHLQDIAVVAGQIVYAGDPLGTIGNADGRYAGAHLHEQICILNEYGVPHPRTFPSDGRYGWVQPSQFYIDHGVDAALVERLAAWDGA
mgnify:CR=1 FL=1